jgi:hypothetical protein
MSCTCGNLERPEEYLLACCLFRQSIAWTYNGCACVWIIVQRATWMGCEVFGGKCGGLLSTGGTGFHECNLLSVRSGCELQSWNLGEKQKDEGLKSKRRPNEAMSRSTPNPHAFYEPKSTPSPSFQDPSCALQVVCPSLIHVLVNARSVIDVKSLNIPNLDNRCMASRPGPLPR